MAARRYGDKEIRDLLKWFEEHNWKVIIPPPGKYAKVRCPCGLHQRCVHKTPSGSNYITNTRMWAQRQPCWV